MDIQSSLSALPGDQDEVTRSINKNSSMRLHEEEKTTAKCDPLLKTLAFQLVAMALFWLSLPRFSKPHNLGP